METFNYGGDSGIVLDRCRACGGVWLDGGELEKVQVLVEASDLALRDDVKRYAARLRSLATREEARAVGDVDAAALVTHDPVGTVAHALAAAACPADRAGGHPGERSVRRVDDGGSAGKHLFI